jgi:hypothetical protein
LVVNSGVLLTGTRFIDNRAQDRGGGLVQFGFPVRVVNGLFARNAAGTAGSAMYLSAPDFADIIHTTIASPTLAAGSAILVAGGQVNLTNTIIASHTAAIELAAGAAFESHNLFFGNGTNLVGSITSLGGSLTGDPRFANPAADDYHLGPGSAALNAGVDAGVVTDFEGDPRPIGAAYDIGFDEWVPAYLYRVLLPLLQR